MQKKKHNLPQFNIFSATTLFPFIANIITLVHTNCLHWISPPITLKIFLPKHLIDSFLNSKTLCSLILVSLCNMLFILHSVMFFSALLSFISLATLFYLPLLSPLQTLLINSVLYISVFLFPGKFPRKNQNKWILNK